VLVGLGLFLSLLVTQPVLTEIHAKAWTPFQEGRLTLQSAGDAASQPVKQFLLKFAKEKDLRLLYEISRTPLPKNPQEVRLSVLVPAYVLSELRIGFQIGAVLFLPFLVIDLIVASVVLSIGMVQLPPVMISAPLKVLLFVLVDGWNLVIGSLVKSFY
jgi:flagellar biosynthetic protein FliP